MSAADCGVTFAHDPHGYRTPRGKIKACDGSTTKRDTHRAGLGVGHIWTAVDCPAYRTLDGADCTCNNNDKRSDSQ